MPILQSMDGKFFDVPDEQAHSFEVPRDQVKALLDKSGIAPPAPQGGPGGGQGPAPGPAGGPAPVVVQIFNGGAPGPGNGPAPADSGSVDPYWWRWTNIRGPYGWTNFFTNY